MDGPRKFPFPILISRHLGAHRSFLGLLAAPPIAGLHPTDPQSLYLPRFKTEERARVSDRAINGLMQGSLAPGLRTGTGLRPVRNRAAQQKVSVRRRSAASSVAPHRSPSLPIAPHGWHYRLNHPRPPPRTWKNCLPRNRSLVPKRLGTAGLVDGGAYTSEARSWSNSPPRAADGGEGGRTWRQSLLPWGGERLPGVGEIDVMLAHQLPGKLAEEHAPRRPFDKLSWRACSDLKVRIITSWGRGKYIGRSVM